MPNIPIDIKATDQTEAKRILSLYQRGERHGVLEEEVTNEAWNAGWTPVGRPIFIGLSNGEPVLYRFEVPVETSLGRHG
ncbi:hypothetical protein GCM10009720_00920 [Yaniella flava]|uniref:Uncharacterized protein n=1 Tax=Yaniella flava TaxID=287930 RepID=A0ABN2TZN1_9MICC